MSQTIAIDTPIGQITIPYSEDSILTFAKKLAKVSEGEPNLLEDAVTDFFGVSEFEAVESDWVFWEDTRTPIFLYDMMKWLSTEYDIVKTMGFSMSKRKATGVEKVKTVKKHKAKAQWVKRGDGKNQSQQDSEEEHVDTKRRRVTPEEQCERMAGNGELCEVCVE